LHGTGVAMYIVGQERRLVDPPSQVVAGVRTVTTNMDGRDALPRMSRPFAFPVSLKFNRAKQQESLGKIARVTMAATDVCIVPSCSCFV
jgi:hypothetical protein